MEARSENFDLKLHVVEGQAPNQQVFVANEELALTSESAVVRPDFIEVEKKTVIKASCIINEKYIIPKSRPQTLHINASYVTCESSFPDNQAPSPMEVASPGSSLESKMEICSEESLMEYSSLESITTTEPVVSSTEATCNVKLAKEKSLVHPDLPYVEDKFIAEISTSDMPPVAENDFQLSKENDQEKEFVNVVPVAEDVFKENRGSSENPRIFQEYGDEKYLETEFVKSSVEKENCRTDEDEIPSIFQQYGNENDLKKEFLKEEKSIPKVGLKRRSSMENQLLLAREESVTAREESCDAREKALKKQEAAIANQKEILEQYYDDKVSPLKRRLKTKKRSVSPLPERLKTKKRSF